MGRLFHWLVTFSWVENVLTVHSILKTNVNYEESIEYLGGSSHMWAQPPAENLQVAKLLRNFWSGKRCLNIELNKIFYCQQEGAI